MKALVLAMMTISSLLVASAQGPPDPSFDMRRGDWVAVRVNTTGEFHSAYSAYHSCVQSADDPSSYSEDLRFIVADGGQPRVVAYGAGGWIAPDIVQAGAMGHRLDPPFAGVPPLFGCGAGSSNYPLMWGDAKTITMFVISNDANATLYLRNMDDPAILSWDVVVGSDGTYNFNDFEQGAHAQAYPPFVADASVGILLRQQFHPTRDFVGYFTPWRDYQTSESAWSCEINGEACPEGDPIAPWFIPLSSKGESLVDVRVDYTLATGNDWPRYTLVGIELPDDSYLS